MRTIVTGGAGFIGSNLVDRLLAEGVRSPRSITSIPSIPGRQGAPTSADRPADPAAGWSSSISATRPESSVVTVNAPKAIVHLAAHAGVRPSIEDPRLRRVNVVGTVHWLEAACRLEPRPRFVYASSSSVYGDRPTAPFRETDPVDLPISPYAATKRPASSSPRPSTTCTDSPSPACGSSQQYLVSVA